MPIKGVFLDVETGSLDPRTGAVTSLAAVAFHITDEGTCVTSDYASTHMMVEPHEEAMVCAKSLKIQGETLLSLASRKGAMSESGAFMVLLDFLKAHTESDTPSVWHKHIWAWNAPFDYAFLREMASRVPGTAGVFPYRPQWGCAQHLYEIAVNTGLLEGARDTSLKTVAASMGIERTPHDALSDCLAAVKVLARTWGALRNTQ